MVAGRVVVSHGAFHGRRNAASGFGKCSDLFALSDACASQTRSRSAGCCCGHYRRQLWTRERSARLFLSHFSWHVVYMCDNVPGALVYTLNNTCVLCVVECARVFHAAGARLVLCGRDAARLQQVVQELTGSATNTHCQVCTL